MTTTDAEQIRRLKVWRENILSEWDKLIEESVEKERKLGELTPYEIGRIEPHMTAYKKLFIETIDAELENLTQKRR